MANSIHEVPWNCKRDGHEFEKLGDYDPDTNSYPYLKCIYCGIEEQWMPEDDAYDY